MKAARVHHAAGSAAAAWPLVARAQQPTGCGASGCSCSCDQRSGVSGRLVALKLGLQRSGGLIGRNIQIDTRLAGLTLRPNSEIRGGIGPTRTGRHPY